ncbi:MAG: 2-succinyl-5-enolpyruvyl-6-hydroxy-3-cyclohexene-1-carboxylic-acid synthase [Vibrio sp.]
MSQAGFNRIWSQAILDTLAKADVEHICIAPGSRSTPLSLEALELAERQPVSIHTHFDERGLGYFALGLAKATHKPVAVIVTSGTAVANLLPCVAEAGLTGEKLILLTADRPEELIGVGANQAIVQNNIFSAHVCKSIELSTPTLADPETQKASLSSALTSINQGLAYQSLVNGALHINCPFREPLYIQNEQEKQMYSELYCEVISQQKSYLEWTQPYPSYDVAELTNGVQQDFINRIPESKGVIVIGKMPLEDAQTVLSLAEKLGWPVLADPQSGVSSEWSRFDLWLQNSDYSEMLSQADCILQFGARMVSKRLGQWIKSQVSSNNSLYWALDPRPQVFNPDHLPQQRTVANIADSVAMIETAMAYLNVQPNPWAEQLKQASVAVKQAATECEQAEELTECQLALRLPELLNDSSFQLFIGNSLIVRLVDMLTQLNPTHVFTNRGASGIDGLIATAAGVQIAQTAKNAPMMTLIGDTSLLYDLNSLALLTHVNHPHVVIVTNNDGGAIFDLLPVPAKQKQTLYQMPHGYQFEHAARQFKLNYVQPTTWGQTVDVVAQYLASFDQSETQSALIVEILTPPEQASQQIKAIIQQLNSPSNFNPNL